MASSVFIKKIRSASGIQEMDNVISVFPPHRKSKTTSSEKRGENAGRTGKMEVLLNPFSLKDSLVEERKAVRKFSVVLEIMLRPEFVRSRHIYRSFQRMKKNDPSSI